MYSNTKSIRNLAKMLLCLVFLSLTSCADVSPHAQDCITSSPYGFWGGLWHGIIAPISFIGSLFFDDIAFYAYNNNGGWYNFGFVLGTGILTFGWSSSSK
jgi:hypothetical protein